MLFDQLVIAIHDLVSQASFEHLGTSVLRSEKKKGILGGAALLPNSFVDTYGIDA